jgi:predicted AlkP superfamily phosphohydrolase/phosphomutase
MASKAGTAGEPLGKAPAASEERPAAKKDRASSAPAMMERWLLAALMAATVAAFLLVLRNRLTPVQRPLTFGLVFWLWFILFYVLLATIGWASAALIAQVTRRADLARQLLALTVVAYLGTLVELNLRLVADMTHPGGPLRFRAMAPAALVLSAVGLLAAALARRKWLLRGVAGLAVACGLGAVAPSWAYGPTVTARPPRVPAAPSGERLLVIGLDGADWQYVEPLMARGEMPNLKALRDQGAWGELATVTPTLSPVIWTTIVTGKPPEEHGIKAFTTTRVGGVRAALPKLHNAKGTGFLALYQALARRGQIFESPITSTSRRVPAFWTIATAYRSPLDVLNWWATWPAEPILGRMVSERVYYYRFEQRGLPPEMERLTYPEALHAELAPLLVTPAALTYDAARSFADLTPEEFAGVKDAPFERRSFDAEFRYFHSMFETERKIALHLIESGRDQKGWARDLMYLCRLVDMACHTSLRHSELVHEHPRSTESELRKYARVVTEAHRAVDHLLGEMIRAFGDGNVVVVSDHGFELEMMGGRVPVYDHREAPPGIFVASGPAFRAGKLEGLSVYDVLPALLRLKGFPVPMDVRGHAPEQAFTDVFLDHHPLRRIASYQATQAGLETRPSVVDEDMLERLRGLGYLE